MRILEKYIIKNLSSIFLSVLVIFLFLYVVVDIFSNLDDMLKQHMTFNILINYYLTFLPTIFVQVSPFASLLATLYTLGGLNKDNEIIAMRSSGLSIWQIIKPILVFSIFISVLVFLVNEKIVPQTAQLNQNIKQNLSKGKKIIQEDTIKNLAFFGTKNRLFFINKFYPKTNNLEGIIILEEDQHQNVLKKIVAQKGVWEQNHWKFYKSITYGFDKNGEVEGEPTYFEEEIMTIPEKPQDFLQLRPQTETMSISTLKKYLSKLTKSGAKTMIRNLRVDLNQKIAFPFASFIITLVGIPFSLAIRQRKHAKLASFGICILISFFYYIIAAISITLGKIGVLPAVLSGWLSHIVFLGLALKLISTIH